MNADRFSTRGLRGVQSGPGRDTAVVRFVLPEFPLSGETLFPGASALIRCSRARKFSPIPCPLHKLYPDHLSIFPVSLDSVTTSLLAYPLFGKFILGRTRRYLYKPTKTIV
jgi:hypothetical protein